MLSFRPLRRCRERPGTRKPSPISPARHPWSQARVMEIPCHLAKPMASTSADMALQKMAGCACWGWFERRASYAQIGSYGDRIDRMEYWWGN